MATRPQTNLDLNQVSLQPTVRGAGRNQVFTAPLPRLTQAQVLAKNLAQFSTVLGQFSNVQRQRAEIDALTKVSNEEVKAQMAGAGGKEMSLLDKIGYEKKYNETLYSRGFQLTVKPLLSKLSSDIKKQGVERLADQGLFDEYINSGLENIEQQIRENIKDKPFMADIHNAMWSKASADFYTEESETYDERRDAYLNDATVDVFARDFPDPIANDEEKTLNQIQTYFNSFDEIFQERGVPNSKIKSLFIDMTSNRIEALAMAGKIEEARLLTGTIQRTSVNKTPLFNDTTTSLKIEKLKRLVDTEEDKLFSRNSKIDDNIIENIYNTAIGPEIRDLRFDFNAAKEGADVLDVFPGAIQVTPEITSHFVNPKIKRLGEIRDLSDNELIALYPSLDDKDNPGLITKFREDLYTRQQVEERKEERDLEALTEDGNVGAALDAIMPEDFTIGDFDNKAGYEKFDKLVQAIKDPDPKNRTLTYRLRFKQVQIRREIFTKAKQKFDREMRRKARELIYINDPDMGPGRREEFMQKYAPKVARGVFNQAVDEFREYMEEEQSRLSNLAGSQNQTTRNTRITPEEQQNIAIGSITEEELIENKDRELLARKDTFPNDGNNKPDVSIESNFGSADNNQTLLGGLFDVKYEEEDLNGYNTKFNNVRKEGLFRNEKEKVDEFFSNLKTIRSNIDFAPSYLKTLREGTVVSPFIGGSPGVLGAVDATEEASGALMNERRIAIGRLILETGLTEEEAKRGIAIFEGDDVGYPIDNIIRVNYNKMSILTLNTIKNFNANIVDAVNTVEEIIKKNDMLATPREFVDAQEKIINDYTLPEQE
tara:strand:- start:5043 stop:7520 length:2478 start_codon:yes stop_codon:yes gene_type:complete